MVEASKAWLDDMLPQRLMPNVIIYNAAISVCGKGQQPQQALHLLQELQLRGLLPNVITYSAAISACEKGSVAILAQGHLGSSRAGFGSGGGPEAESAAS